MAASAPTTSPGHDISPKTAVPVNASGDYFRKETGGSTASHRADDSVDSSEFKSSYTSTLSDTTPAPSMSQESQGGQKVTGLSRHSSVSSVTIQLPRNPNLPQGCEKRMNRGRLRNASPKPERFQNRVAFDNIPLGEATKNNTPSLTLNDRHKGYRAGRRSRTFMVGVDEHAYSDYALQWLLDELVDDGDEVVCVRVMEKDIRTQDKSYQEEARSIMDSIRAKNTAGKALSFILEYAVGKLHGTFQKLIHMHEPAMLVVGTRGRSLGGLQGLVNTRNSFSKYCLQYSPVPVVVVRPTEKRIKKKEKRAADASRQTYAGMLSATDGKHEADSEASRQYDLEVKISPDEEAHQVAKVLGLPASFDPTIRPLASTTYNRITPSPTAPTLQVMAEVPQTEASVSTGPLSAGSESSDSEDDDAEGEFEVMTGDQALDQAKKRELHKMEVGEAMALRDHKLGSDSDSDDEGDSKNAS
ncbi:uncharacterized protein J7T54_005208 [Emericellopsis cladophorae]|uniref:UspA domain-containing protein n=1 Tax=Emericellopsis cladophorae TaxID=2686198 RepID=A0A9P9XX04_9HYPO|nr:uncharacterized protein J7T54_005208 [Emericellopsis cladophorae]KAI6779394.1 hypothetical protein J7T54_005208 [Emericellopsis cladophorae]